MYNRVCPRRPITTTDTFVRHDGLFIRMIVCPCPRDFRQPNWWHRPTTDKSDVVSVLCTNGLTTKCSHGSLPYGCPHKTTTWQRIIASRNLHYNIISCRCNIASRNCVGRLNSNAFCMVLSPVLIPYKPCLVFSTRLFRVFMCGSNIKQRYLAVRTQILGYLAAYHHAIEKFEIDFESFNQKF